MSQLPPDQWARQFLETVRQMRIAQRRYFKSRAQTDLVAAKRLEADVDELLKDPTPTVIQIELPE